MPPFPSTLSPKPCRLFWVITLVGLSLSYAQAVNFPPIVSADADPKEMFLGDSISFSSSGTVDPNGDPLTYSWDFGNGDSSTLPNPSYVYPSAGEYTVVLSVSDGLATRHKSLSITVLDPIVSPSATRTQTMALSHNRNELWVVNPDSNSVSIIDVSDSPAVKLAEIPVGDKPRTVSLSNDETKAYVVCEADNSLYQLDAISRTIDQMKSTGHMPYGVVVARSSDKVVISNQGDGTIQVFTPDLSSSQTITTGEMPRAIAITRDGNTAYVTDYLTEGNTGTVWQLDLVSNSVVKTISLVEDPGPDTSSSGKGFPNLLSAIAIEPSGKYLWVGGLKSNTSRGTLLSGEALTPTNRIRGVIMEIDLSTNEEILEHRVDTNDADSSADLCFSPDGHYLLTVHQGAETMSIYDIPVARTITDKSDGTGVNTSSRSDVGFAPQGILLSADGNTAYINNFLSRNVSIHNVSDPANPSMTGTVSTTTEPLSSNLINGKRMFYRSKEPLHSESNYIACASCHADGGMSDGRTWDFTQAGEGLRNTIDLRGKGGMSHGPVHWSANFNEIQDFENDIVHGFGGSGLAQDGQAPHHPLDGAPNSGRSQNLDDLAAYVSSLDKSPPSPHRQSNGLLTAQALEGRKLFYSSALNCSSCHTPGSYTDSTLTADPADFVLHDVGTILPSSGQRLGNNLPGFDTPSLEGVWATAPYLHDGRAATLREVLTTHNSSDQHGVTSHLNTSELDALVAFLESIDGSPNDQLPEVDAGSNITTHLGWVVNLSGSISDDGLPSSPGQVNQIWETDATQYHFVNNSIGQTAIQFNETGNFTLTLKANDDGSTTYPSQDSIQVTVQAANNPPDYSYTDFQNDTFTAPEQADPNISGMDADPDSDSKKNILEYFMGTQPKSSGDFDSLGLTFEYTSAGIKMLYSTEMHPTDVNIQWLRSTDLINWSTATPAASGVSANNGSDFTIETHFIDSASPVFYKIDISN